MIRLPPPVRHEIHFTMCPPNLPIGLQKLNSNLNSTVIITRSLTRISEKNFQSTRDDNDAAVDLWRTEYSEMNNNN
jgi:hypothetical protein